ncbi:alpha-latroinsectotoxin-Lt1a-like [Macadamia integrifolia]|uniref:alpha-latroinsectotoxin-Lt1a-like n=1 Tax=Macadamia integrifolia TaxID=60698 RepID=UPI001C4FCFE3|nr:alpha-latroinsectotoxin-Lt1a-like [Macadamia integrifolia]
MNSDLYNAAAGGDIETLKRISNSELLESQETPQKNTVLHVAVQVASARNEKGPYFEKEKIEEICKICPALIRRVNSKGDTPLHIAARGGRSDIVKLLVDEDAIPRSLVTMVNSKKDTALHEALRNHHLFDRKYQNEYLEVVKTLLQKEPELSNFINDAGESPAFMATREGLCDFLVVILNLDCCKEYGGPGKSTALHAAVLLREDGEKTGIYDYIQSAKTAGGTRNIGMSLLLI